MKFNFIHTAALFLFLLNNQLFANECEDLENYATSTRKSADHKIAHKLCLRDCNLNDGQACANVGIQYELGESVPVNYEKAKQYYEKACTLNYGRGCFSLAFLSEQGVLKKNLKNTDSYYEKGCNLGYGLSCFKRGVRHKDNAILAKSYYEKGCKFNDNYSCYSLAEIYLNGNGVERNNKLAAEFYKKSCDLGSIDACHDLAPFYEQGVGIEQNIQEAKKLYKATCTMDAPGVCDDYLRLNKRYPD